MTAEYDYGFRVSTPNETDIQRGDRLEEMREELDLSKRYLAQSLGTQTSRITEWEKGAPISPKYLRRLSVQLMTSVDYILREEGERFREPMLSEVMAAVARLELTMESLVDQTAGVALELQGLQGEPGNGQGA